MEKIMEKLFALPPVEKRKISFELFNMKNSMRQFDDVYIFYLIMRTSFLVAAFFSLLNLISHATGGRFDFHFFTIDLTHADFVKTFLLTYTKYTATILLFPILPFYVLLFRVHINPKTYDSIKTNPLGVMEAQAAAQKLKTMSNRKFWSTGVVCFLGMPVAMYGSFVFFIMNMTSFHLENSAPYLVFCAVALPCLLALFNQAFLGAIMVIWRYSGDHMG